MNEFQIFFRFYSIEGICELDLFYNIIKTAKNDLKNNNLLLTIHELITCSCGMCVCVCAIVTYAWYDKKDIDFPLDSVNISEANNWKVQPTDCDRISITRWS